MTSGVKNRKRRAGEQNATTGTGTGTGSGAGANARSAKKKSDDASSTSALDGDKVKEIEPGSSQTRVEDEDEVPRRRHSERRRSGDGESLPDTPPSESPPPPPSTESEPDVSKPERSVPDLGRRLRPSPSPFVVTLSVDAAAVVLFIVGAAARIAFLEHPKNVVFDEMHYGKYALMYLRRTFFFDSNPPLGKMLVALSARVAGYEWGGGGDGAEGGGDDQEKSLGFFDRIGTPYPNSVPVFAMRLVPALSGSALAPIAYMILCELGVSPGAGLLAGTLMLMDTALLAQSRFILLEPIMLLFSMLSVLSVLRFRRHQRRPFSPRWWGWIFAAASFMGMAFCVKYLAIYSCWLCCLILSADFWRRRLRDRSLSAWRLTAEAASQCAVLCLLPAAIYVGAFRLHLSLLTRAGSHDSLMTSAFQASLEGGLGSIVRGQPAEVAHGSQITLRHTHGKTCWLHSHEHVYPVRYEDGRGSSHQQQVSCYGYKDVNNWWIVKRPDREDLAVHDPVDVVSDGDTIQLVHGMTHRALNSHDVAAPMSPHNQEISCYIDYNISMASENLWKVDIVNAPHTGTDKWNAIASQVRLIHVSTGQALRFSPRVYPEWGFHQHEVVADKAVDQMDTVWNVEEHRYTKNDEDKKTLEKELFNHELIPQHPTHMSFLEKFAELQLKMLVTNQENVQNHNYASDPTEWPTLTRGIAYFVSKTSNAQVHLLGNVVIWYSGTLSVLVFCGLLVLYLLRRRRQCYDLPDELFSHFVLAGEVLVGGYLIHYLPFFFYDRTLFVSHYLPAYLFKIMVVAFIGDHLQRAAAAAATPAASRLLQRSASALALAFCLCAGAVALRFAPLALGFVPLTGEEVRALQWRDTWDLIVHKP